MLTVANYILSAFYNGSVITHVPSRLKLLP